MVSARGNSVRSGVHPHSPTKVRRDCPLTPARGTTADNIAPRPFPQIILPQSRATDRRPPQACVPWPSINACLPHAPPAGHWPHWPWYQLARAIAFLGAEGRSSATQARTTARGATLMRIDLKKVNAEMTSLRSKLAAIDNDLDECRRRHFEHPGAWSQIRQGLTFERHRVQRRLEEFTFARRCACGRPLGPVVMLSFRSLASPGEPDTEGVEHLEQAPNRFQDGPPSFEAIDRPCNAGA